MIFKQKIARYCKLNKPFFIVTYKYDDMFISQIKFIQF